VGTLVGSSTNWVVKVGIDVDLTAVTPEIVISKKATRSPSAQPIDFTAEGGSFEYTVTVESGIVQVPYTVSAEPYEGYKTLEVKGPKDEEGTYTDYVSPEYVQGGPLDLSRLVLVGTWPVTLTAGGRTASFEITVSPAFTGKSIVSFTVLKPGQDADDPDALYYNGVLSDDGKSIIVWVEQEFNGEPVDIRALKPVIAISAGASIYPASGETVDFTQPVTYTVTPGVGDSNDYTVTVHPKDSALIGLTVPPQ
jgi:hypothetical protein